MAPRINERETVARFLRKGDFSATKMRARRQAFEPVWYDQDSRFETSVYRVSTRSADEMTQIAIDHVEPSRGRQAARAMLSIADARSVLLDVDSAAPPPRHAVIVGWSKNDEDHMSAALELVNLARVELLF